MPTDFDVMETINGDGLELCTPIEFILSTVTEDKLKAPTFKWLVLWIVINLVLAAVIVQANWI